MSELGFWRYQFQALSQALEASDWRGGNFFFPEPQFLNL